MVARLRDPRQAERHIDDQAAPVDACDDLAPMLATFHAGVLFTVLDGLQACLASLDKCDVGLVSRRIVCDTAPVDIQPMEKSKCQT